MSKISLDKILQSQGFGSRRWCAELIADGEVSINGEVVNDSRARVETGGLQFSIYGELWTYREHVYIALNKPANYECSRKASHHPGVLTLLPEQFHRRDVQPVGRLDHDTTGLLLMSDDGPFIHKQSSPKHHVPKVYVATTHDAVTPELVATLLKGVQLHDEPAPLAAVSCRMIEEHQIEIVLEQGKYHQTYARRCGESLCGFVPLANRAVEAGRFASGRGRLVLLNRGATGFARIRLVFAVLM
jgi:16S rRNA pseudouridine516 synthase